MKPYYVDDQVTLYHGDALETLRQMPDQSVHCCVTSPPYYGLRDYGEPGQYGLEPSPAEYVGTMRQVFGEVRRVLAGDGTMWLNLGDSYATAGGAGRQGSSGQRADRTFTAEGLPPRGDMAAKNLLGMPWRVAFALQDGGWILRNAAVWHKPNAMPESIKDRLSSRHELVFLFAKSSRYWFDLDPIREPHEMKPQRRPAGRPVDEIPRPGQPRQSWSTAVRDTVGVDGHPAGRNPGDVWALPTQPFPEAHFAVMPPGLAERCILAGCRPGGVVLDPFAGSGTTGMVALKHGRRFVGVDLSAKYLDLSLRTRLAQSAFVDEVAS